MLRSRILFQRPSRTLVARVTFGAVPALVMLLQTRHLWLWYARKALSPYFGDFAALWAAAVAFDSGLDPYDPTSLLQIALSRDIPVYYGPFNYPPATLLVLRPLARLSLPMATGVWIGVLVSALVATFLLFTQTFLKEHKPFAVALMALAFASSYPIAATVDHGNIDVLILLLVAVVLRFAPQSAAIAGAALGGAVSLKIVPAVFLGAYYVWKRQWRLVAVAFGVGFALLVVALAFTGADFTMQYFTHRVPTLLSGDYGYPIANPLNQSLGGFFGRLFTRDGDTTPWVNAPVVAVLLHLAAAGVFVVIALRVWSQARTAAQLKLGAALVMPLAILLPRLSWDRYAIWLLPAYTIALCWLLDRPASRRTITMGFLLAFSYAFSSFRFPFDDGNFISSAPLLSGPLIPLASGPMFGTVLFFVFLALAIREPADPSDLRAAADSPTMGEVDSGAPDSGLRPLSLS